MRTVMLGGIAVVFSLVSLFVLMTLVRVGTLVADVGVERFLGAAQASATI